MRTKSGTYAMLLLTAIILYSCAAKQTMITPTQNDLVAVANLSGSSEVPANTSTATGTGQFTYNAVDQTLIGSITFSGFTTATTMAHIHKGAPGVAGGVVFTIEASGPFSSPITYTSHKLTQSQYDDLAAGNYYVNIHTTAFPDGEIRGQLIIQTGSSY